MKKKILTVIMSVAVVFCGCSGAALNSEAVSKSDNVQAVSSVQNTKYTYAVKDFSEAEHHPCIFHL